MKKIKMLKIILSVLFIVKILIADQSPNQSPKYQWKEINLPTDNYYGIADISSKNNFWVYEKTGNFIYHFEDSITQKIELPKISNEIEGRNFNCIKFNTMKFFTSMTDANYHTHFFVYELGNWNEFNIEADVPVRNFYKISEDELYIYGDWGNIFHYKNNKLKKIKSPIENHIMAFGYYNDENIWFGVRKEGIYHYDGKKFKNIPIENYNNLDILYIFVKSKNGIRIFFENGDVYIYNSNKFYYIILL